MSCVRTVPSLSQQRCLFEVFLDTNDTAFHHFVFKKDSTLADKWIERFHSKLYFRGLIINLLLFTVVFYDMWVEYAQWLFLIIAPLSTAWLLGNLLTINTQIVKEMLSSSLSLYYQFGNAILWAIFLLLRNFMVKGEDTRTNLSEYPMRYDCFFFIDVIIFLGNISLFFLEPSKEMYHAIDSKKCVIYGSRV